MIALAQPLHWTTGLKWLVRLGIGGLLLYAGVIKLFKPMAFYGGVLKLTWLPPWAQSLLAGSLPPLEVVVGLCILTGFWANSAWLIVIGGLLPAFITFHLLYPGGCGCLG